MGFAYKKGGYNMIQLISSTDTPPERDTADRTNSTDHVCISTFTDIRYVKHVKLRVENGWLDWITAPL